VLTATTILSLFADLWTKSWAFATLAGSPVNVQRDDVLAVRGQLWQLIPDHPAREVIPNILSFKLVLNPGAVFGMGAGKRWFFVVFTLFALGVGVWMFSHWTRPRDRWTHAAIGLVLGGGLGNLYDRLRFACVRDFIHPLPDVMLPFGWSWPWGGREIWPYVSNVADAILIVGVGFLAIRALRQSPHSRSEQLGEESKNAEN
jgi:signal peptidase II